ncbi:hypothetical protein NG798_27190 [Ancylothrix sp. C2]|nr:hypothetical protein [Ancylothrix sp. D3o]MCT7953489.1 hypothetical protein [Ancylothrix sp. D3o]
MFYHRHSEASSVDKCRPSAQGDLTDPVFVVPVDVGVPMDVERSALA